MRALVVVTAASVLAVAHAPAQQPAGVPLPSPAATTTPPRFDPGPGLEALATAVRSGTLPAGAAAGAATLAFVANGSTMRTGPHRNELKMLARGLKDREPAAQRPPDLLPELLGALALVEVTEHSNYKLLMAPANRNVAAILGYVADDEQPPLPAEEHTLLRLLAARLETAGLLTTHRTAGAEAAASARVSFRLGAGRRSDAAHLLGRRLGGHDIAPDLLLATAWPADPAADPLHTWFGVLATQHAAEKQRADLLETLDRLIAQRAPADAAEHAGTWAAAGGFDRLTTTALFTMCLGLANRAFANQEQAGGR